MHVPTGDQEEERQWRRWEVRISATAHCSWSAVLSPEGSTIPARTSLPATRPTQVNYVRTRLAAALPALDHAAPDVGKLARELAAWCEREGRARAPAAGGGAK